MIRSLPLLHRIAGQRVVVVGEGEMAEAKKRLVERAGGIPCGEPEAHHAQLAFIALEDEKAAEAAARRLSDKGLLVNVADRPELCAFTTPSILDRDPVLIAIGTSGASAGMAKQLRLRLEAMLPQTVGALAGMLQTKRDAIRARWPDGADRRNALDTALAQGGALDLVDPASAERIEDWLAAADKPSGSRIVEMFLTSDDPEDLTLRQARLLGTVDTLIYDPAIPAAILDRARADALRREWPYDEPHPGLTIILRPSAQI